MIQMPPNNNYFLNSNETCMLNANPEAFIQTTTSTSSAASSTNITNISNTNNNNNNLNLTNTNANLTLNNNNSNINNSTTSLSYYTEIINHSAVLVDQQITNSLQQTNLNLNYLNEESTRDLNGYIKLDEAKLVTYEQQPKSIVSNSDLSSNADDEELVFTLMDEDYINDNLLLDIDTSYGLNNNDAANTNFGLSNANIVNSTLPIPSAQDISTSGAHYSNSNNHANAQIYIKQEYNHDEATNSSYSCSGSEPTPVKTEIVHVNQKNGKTVVEKHYGPIVVRPRKKPAPTLASGRKSKYIELSADESAKRETRRERNRQAAEKCKQKRTEIETKLENELVRLENEKRALDEQMCTLEKAKRDLQLMFDQHAHKCTTRINTNNPPIQQQQQQQLQTTNLNSFSHPHQSYNNTTTYGTYAQTSYNPPNVTQQQASSTIHQYYPNYNQSNLALNHQVHMSQQAPQSTQTHLFIPQQTSSTQPYDQHKIPWSN